jgi:hypothetical protein
MPGDCINDRVPIRPMQFVTAAFEEDEFRAWDRLRQRNAVFDRVNRIGRAVYDEKRRFYFMQPATPLLTYFQSGLVCFARITARSIKIPFDERSGLRLVERMCRAREHARVLDHVIDHLGPVRPVNVFSSRHVLSEGITKRRKMRLGRPN